MLLAPLGKTVDVIALPAVSVGADVSVYDDTFKSALLSPVPTVYIPVSVVDVAFVNTTVSPVSSVTVIDAPSTTASLKVAVILTVVPIPYVPFDFVEENEVTVGLVASTVMLKAAVDVESIPEAVCFAVTDQTPSTSVPRSQPVCAVAVNVHVTFVCPDLVAVTVTVLPFDALPTEIVGVLSDVMSSVEDDPESDAVAKSGVAGALGGATYVNPPAKVALGLTPVATTTSFPPAVPDGVVQVIEVEETTTTDVHEIPPMVTVAPVMKLVPVIVTEVPPAVEPEVGEILVTVGGPETGTTFTLDDATESPTELTALR
jgi:hypothetical protein